MNSTETLRRPSSYRRGPSQRRQEVEGHNVVAPLSGPSYGPYAVVKRRWRKPLGAILADALTNSRAVLARLDRGLYMPDAEGKGHYQSAFNTLCDRTRQQIQALEEFSAIEWRE